VRLISAAVARLLARRPVVWPWQTFKTVRA
jgi:hypothetical protein